MSGSQNNNNQSNKKLTETEVKIHVPDLDTIRARLESAGAALESGRVFERNVRYEDAAQTFTGRGIVLRLREDNRVRLTVKESPTLVDGMMARFEAEVTLDDFDVMDIILQKLGFKPFVVYEKYRTTYQLGAVEIVLDEMPYGNFVEIEGEPDTIRAALDTLGLADAPRIGMSYLSLFEHIKAALDLAMHDLTFANFAGIDVPEEVIAWRR
jgi:adenylate cyclase class 2